MEGGREVMEGGGRREGGRSEEGGGREGGRDGGRVALHKHIPMFMILSWSGLYESQS